MFSRQILGCAALGALLLAPFVGNAAEVLYETSFEDSGQGSAEDFPAGDFLAPQTIGSWELVTGEATVRAGDAIDGLQFVTLSAGAQFDRSFAADITSASTGGVFIEGWFRGTGSTLDLARAVYPADEEASAIVHFSADEGIQLLDGDRAGGEGQIVSTAFPLGNQRATVWHRITVYLDFDAQTWSCYIRELGQSGFETYPELGFRNDVSSLKGFRNLAESASDFDAFRVVAPTLGDANGDGVLDAADVVRVTEYSISGADDPILQFNADMDRNGSVDGSDVAILVDIVRG